MTIEKERISSILNEEMQRRKINEDRVQELQGKMMEYEKETSKIIERLKRQNEKLTRQLDLFIKNEEFYQENQRSLKHEIENERKIYDEIKRQLREYS